MPISEAVSGTPFKLATTLSAFPKSLQHGILSIVNTSPKLPAEPVQVENLRVSGPSGCRFKRIEPGLFGLIT